ncbi:MAG TPA: GPW/gp25 family protein [Armatimonadota bacterium]|nr:GPW/gp25 family protein [Armatimonadota bacterium]
MSTDFLGKGLRFPFAFQRRSGGAQVSTITSTDHAHIHESILQILGTRPGERFMNPEFGSHVRDLVFEPNGSVLKGLLRHYITDDVERWEKRVYVTDVSFDESPEAVDSNTLYIRISYRVIDTQVSGNLVWPFCREEMTESSDTGARRVAVG